MRKNLKRLTSLVMSIIVLSAMSLSAMAMPNYTFDTAETDGLMPVKEVIFSEDFSIPASGDLADNNSIWGEGGNQTVTVALSPSTVTSEDVIVTPRSALFTADTIPSAVKSE